MSEYYSKRCKEIGITEKNNSIKVWDDLHDKSFTSNFLQDWETPAGIKINYFTHDGKVCKYESDKRKLSDFYRIRLTTPNGSGKYWQPPKSGVKPFITPGIIDKYKKKIKIKTLVIVEGEFKALAGCIAGLDIIGIGGIHNFKEDNNIHHYITDVVKICEVKNVILLFDADVLSENVISAQLAENKDLATRLHSFYSAIKSFRELSKPLNVDVYFSHIRPEYETKAKGLDDLLNFFNNVKDDVVKDLLKLSKGNEYFHTQNISDNSLNTLYSYFHLELKKGKPQSFYDAFSQVILDKEFIFNTITYQDEDGKLKVKKHPAALKFMRVGTEYYFKSHTFTSAGEKVEFVQKWKKGEITEDWNHIPKFISMIPKYISFINVPDNTANYKEVIEGCLNQYHRIQHIPTPSGTHEKITNFLKHLFGNHFNVALDYLTILHRYPTQNLPVLCLVSRERGSGKSTFLKLLNYIYGDNAIILGNEDFSKNFNSHWATKLIIGVDESVIDQQIIKEKIKRLSTDNKINVESKGKDIYNIGFIGKFMLCSNKEDNFINIEDEENRFFVVKVCKPANTDFSLLSEMQEEVPSFLHFIETRDITNKQEDRLWFRPELYFTDALRKVVLSSKTAIEKEMINYFTEIFNYLDDDEIKFTPKLLRDQIEKQIKNYSSVQTHIERIIKDNWKMTPQANSSFDFPYIESTEKYSGEPLEKEGKEINIKWIKYVKGQFYIMKKDFLFTISN